MDKMKILYVDNNRSNLYLFSSCYSDAYDVYTAANEEVAIRMLEDFDFEFVISDQMLDSLSGEDFLKFVSQTWSNTNTVLLTACNDPMIYSNVNQKNDVDHYLIKPYNPRKLSAIFRQAG